MKLIEYSNYRVTISDEAFLVKPIRKIFNKDRTVNKESFFQQMSYLFFMVDPRSSYMYITDPEERSKEIIEQEGLGDKFKPSEDLQEAMTIYAKLTVTTSALLLEDARLAVEKVRSFLRDVDLNAKDDKGKYLVTISSITAAIKQVPQLAKDLISAEQAVNKEILEEGRARGGNDSKTIGEDGLDAFL